MFLINSLSLLMGINELKIYQTNRFRYAMSMLSLLKRDHQRVHVYLRTSFLRMICPGTTAIALELLLWRYYRLCLQMSCAAAFVNQKCVIKQTFSVSQTTKPLFKNSLS